MGDLRFSGLMIMSSMISFDVTEVAGKFRLWLSMHLAKGMGCDAQREPVKENITAGGV